MSRGKSARHGAESFAEELRYAMSLRVASNMGTVDSLDLLHPNLTVPAHFIPFNARANGFELHKRAVKYDGDVGGE
jgi:hypothetical protein